MRNIVAIAAVILAALILAPVQAQQEGAGVLEEITDAFAAGDVERIMEWSGERIDLTVFGAKELLSNSQARYVVRSFIAEHPPVVVEMIDRSESDGNWFASVAYSYETGTSPLVVYLRLRRGVAGWELRELRFDRSAPR